MVAFGGSDAVDGNMKATGGDTTIGPVVAHGYILTNDSTTNRVQLHQGGDVVPIGISAGPSQKDADGTQLVTADASVSFYPVHGLLYVRAKASQTWTTGLGVYCGDGGLALDGADASGQQLGIYVGTGVTSGSVDGDTLIPVLCSGVGHA
jgi:hypothetical protein